MSLELDFANLAAARRDLQVNPTQRGEASTNGFSEIFRLGVGAGQSRFEKFAGFLFHGPAVAGGAYAETALGSFWKFADCDAGHAINDSIDGIDCTMRRFLWKTWS
jgi:hypothetical protein